MFPESELAHQELPTGFTRSGVLLVSFFNSNKLCFKIQMYTVQESLGVSFTSNHIQCEMFVMYISDSDSDG
jgi:hypothetical protein